jgi:hypothetical protein
MGGSRIKAIAIFLLASGLATYAARLVYVAIGYLRRASDPALADWLVPEWFQTAISILACLFFLGTISAVLRGR